MNDYSYHTVSSIINAFQKSVNFPFKTIKIAIVPCQLGSAWLSTQSGQFFVIHIKSLAV